MFRSAKDAVDFAADADMAGGTFQGEIEIVQDGYSISDDLAELAEVSTFETTKGGLRRALSALKKKDGAIIYTANPARLRTRWTRNAVLRWFDENYDPETPGVRGNDETAYYYTLYLIATGNKFHWDNKTTANGRTTLYGIESSLFGRKSPAEKKAYRAILTKRGEKGIYPEQLAEYIQQSTDSDEIVLGGAAVILKKRTGSLRGVGNVRDRNKYINLAMKIYDIAHNDNSYNKTVSFDELGVPFQYYILMDMRHDGFIVLGTTIDEKPGVLLKEYFYNLPRHRFFEEIKNYLKSINYE